MSFVDSTVEWECAKLREQREGDWARFFRQGSGYIGTELLRDVETPGRYLVVDRWETAAAYNDFTAAHRDEYMRRVDDTRFHYEHELRFGTFENVWRSEE